MIYWRERDATQHTDHRGVRWEKEKSPTVCGWTLESGNVNKTMPITDGELRFCHAAFAPFSRVR
jgi:hypothetical protein